jgi:hypothetical protein
MRSLSSPAVIEFAIRFAFGSPTFQNFADFFKYLGDFFLRSRFKVLSYFGSEFETGSEL